LLSLLLERFSNSLILFIVCSLEDFSAFIFSPSRLVICSNKSWMSFVKEVTCALRSLNIFMVTGGSKISYSREFLVLRGGTSVDPNYIKVGCFFEPIRSATVKI
jgi:hypothetical protein